LRGGKDMQQFWTGLFKIALASLLTGVFLSFFGITADTILARIGMTPESLWQKTVAAIHWAIPNIALGAIIVLPVWLIAYIFLPPRHLD